MVASRTGKKVLDRQERVVEQIAQGLLELPADQLDHLSALRIRYLGAAAQNERDAIRLVAADVLGPTVARLDLESLRREETSRKRVGQNIKRHRQALGLTQQALGARAGLAQAYICRLERGLHVARAKTITTLAAALNLQPADLDPSREGCIAQKRGQTPDPLRQES